MALFWTDVGRGDPCLIWEKNVPDQQVKCHRLYFLATECFLHGQAWSVQIITVSMSAIFCFCVSSFLCVRNSFIILESNLIITASDYSK